MKKVLFVLMGSLMISTSAFAQFGDLLNKVQSNPLLAQQGGIQAVIAKAQSIAGAFAQMPLNSGKLEFIKAALPLLTQAKAASADPAQATKVSGLLDQVKSLVAQKWSSTPLSQTQIPQATSQVQQLSDALKGIVSNEGGVLKGLLQTPIKH